MKPGLNRITRKSTASTLTVPRAQSYNNLQQDLRNERPHCGCGWPEHLLIPRGNAEGMPFDLFLMATSGEEDAVARAQPPASDGCIPAPIFCGIQGELYPDAKPMGYPFDRRPYSVLDPELGVKRPAASIEEYVLGVGNMGTVPVRVFHRGGDELAVGGNELVPGESSVNCVPYRYRYVCLLQGGNGLR